MDVNSIVREKLVLEPSSYVESTDDTNEKKIVNASTNTAEKTNANRSSTSPSRFLHLSKIICSSITRPTITSMILIWLGVILMIVGILVVCFMSPKHTNGPCLFKFQSKALNPASHQSRPWFVVVGDLNKDHRMDFVVANSDANIISVYLGYGDGTFAHQNMYSTGPKSSPYSIAIGDFDNDTLLDIAVANYRTNSIGIFIGYANGTYSNQRIFSLGSSRPISIIANDFNKDNRLDIVSANDGTNNIGILLGCGDGYFRDQITYSTGYDSMPRSIIAADFNGDTQLDIAVANYGSKSVGILLGYGNGSFANQIMYYTVFGYSPYSIAIGDFNGDTRLDIAIAYYDHNRIGIFLGHESGEFSSEVTFSVSLGTNPSSIIVGDFNKDTRQDIAVANYNNDSVSVFLGYGDGSFQNPLTYSTGLFSSPKSIAIGDFNNDTRIDMIVANSNTYDVEVLLGYDHASFQSKITFSTGSNSKPVSISTSDFNKDNCLDMVIANYDKYAASVFLGTCNGTFIDAGTYPIGFLSSPKSIAIGDFNNDTSLDIVVVNENTHDFGVLLGYGNGSFFQLESYPPLGGVPSPFPPTYSTGSGTVPCTVALGDFNDDRLLDIVVGYSKPEMIGIFLGYGNGSFASQKTISILSRVQSVAIADFNDDHQLDVVAVSDTYSRVTVLLGYGNGTFGRPILYSIGIDLSSCSVTVGDFNGDNIIDIAVANPGMTNIGLLFGHGDGTFATQIRYSTNFPVYSIATGDFNKDNRLDIVIASSTNNIAAVLVGYGNGSFTMEKTYSTGLSPQFVAVGDFNNDNRLDFAVANSRSNTVDVLLGYDYGRLGLLTTYPSVPLSRPLSVAVGDFNNDTRADVVVANSGTDNIEVFLNDKNTNFELQDLYAQNTTSLPYSVATDDFNRDNQLDIVVANYGTNNVGIFNGYVNGKFEREVTYQIGSGTHPISVATGDFNNDSWPDIAVANDGTHNVGILLGYDPAFFSNLSFFVNVSASGSISIAVGDFNSDSCMDFAVVYFKSNSIGIFLGNGNGTFVIGKVFATDSGPYSIVVSDFNNDNCLDMVVTNSDANSVSIFLGYGDGMFAAQIRYTTGSSPKFVAVGDFNTDTFVDIAVVHSGDNTIGIFLGYGDGIFAEQKAYATGSYPYSIAVGDFNQDNHLDIIVANNNDGSVGILRGYGNGTFSSQSAFSIGSSDNLILVAIGDFNADDRLDIAVGDCYDNNIGIFLGHGNGTFSTKYSYSTGFGSNPRSIVVADMNNDGLLDIAFSTAGNDAVIFIVGNEEFEVDIGYTSVGVFLGHGNGNFSNLRTYSTGLNSGAFFIAISDFNNDKRLDIVVVDYDRVDIGLLVGYKYAIFKNVTIFSSTAASHPRSITTADFNNDDILDITVANSGCDSIDLFLGYGDGRFMSAITYSTGSGSQPYSIAVGDFNKDNWLDIVVAKYGFNSISLLFGYGNGTFRSEMTYSTGSGSHPYSVNVGDFNNDDCLDVVIVKYGSHTLSVMFGNNNGTLGIEIPYLIGYDTRPCSVAVADFNDDNRLDIIITNLGANNVHIMLNTC